VTDVRAVSIAKRSSSWLPTVGVLVVTAVLWQVAPPILGLQSYMLPTISDLYQTFRGNADLLETALWVTSKEALFGLLLGLIIGSAFGVVCHYVTAIRAPATALLVGLTSVPLIGMAPISILIFGAGTLSKVILVAFITTFTMTLYTIGALDHVPRDEERLLLAFHMPEHRIFTVLRVPAALPQFLTGLRFAAGQAVLMAIVGELFSAQDGIGAVIMQQSSLSGYDVMWAASVEGAFAGLLFFLVATIISKRWTRWA
jgi:NitT/TauT family transport system permease protein